MDPYQEILTYKQRIAENMNILQFTQVQIQNMQRDRHRLFTIVEPMKYDSVSLLEEQNQEYLKRIAELEQRLLPPSPLEEGKQ